MSDPSIEELVRDVREATGASPPLVLEQSAPVLDDEARARSSTGGFYLVGLVGGKDVGKSALVNALVGQPITEQTSHGPGTETVIAYAHVSQEAALRELLQHEAPGKFRIVTHEQRSLVRQVLVDLPDVDSHWEDHALLTRRMLRQMLFPLWLTTVEKYADQRVMDMLRRVAEGNAAENFVFVLNKMDQLGPTPARARELSEDYSRRLQQALKLNEAPKVWTIAAIQPAQFELPKLREMLTREKETRIVERSAERAGRTKTASIVAWLGEQNLPQRVERLDRLESTAEELVQSRIGAVALDRASALIEDPARRLEIVDECQRVRASRWPIVNVLHVLLSPLLLLIRENLRRAPAATIASVDQQRLSREIAASFAALQQEDPQVAPLYRNWKLWDAMEADNAAGALWRRLEQTTDRQKQLVREQLTTGSNPIAGFFRLLFTIGAIVWFIALQPLLEIALRTGASSFPIADLGLIAVRIFSSAALLESAAFLILYFFALWLLLRWATQRRVDRMLARFSRSNDPSISPAAATMDWINDTLRPIKDARQRLATLAEREQDLRKSIAA